MPNNKYYQKTKTMLHMKKILLTITGIFVTLLTMAQSPNLMNFQGVARNSVGNVIPNQQVTLRLSILTGTATGSVVYSETRNVITNAFGLFNVVLGSPGTLLQTGTIAGVNWSGFPSGGANKYLQVEIDPNGGGIGGSFTNVGSTQMVSVPYALNAGGAAPIGPAGGDLTGTYPNPQILIPLIKTQNVPASPMISMTNTATTGTTSAFALFGSSASTDGNASAIQGIITSTTPGGFSSGLRGTNNGTSGSGIGVWGAQSGTGYGVYGQTPGGWGVRGETNSGYGVAGYAFNTGGIGVYGTSAANAAGYFENTTAGNTNNTVTATSNSAGNTVNGVNTGTGRAGLFQVQNAASTASAIEAQTNGTGASWGVRSTSTGTNGAGLFVQSNAANTANNVLSNQAGLGTAGLFQTTNTANTADALLVTTNTTSTTPAAVHGTAGTSGISLGAKKGIWGDTDTGWGVYGTSSSSVGVGGTTSTGTGVSAFAFSTGTALSATSLTGVSASISSPAGNNANMMTGANAGNANGLAIDNTNAAGTANTIATTNANVNSTTISATTGGGAAIFARKGSALSTFFTNPAAGYFSMNDPSAATGIGVLSVTNNGYGVAGVTINNGFGVLGQASTANSAGLVGFNSGTGYALVTVGKVQIQGQGAGAGKVLSSDAVGNATWNTFAALGAVTGSGTLNWVPKWTPNGTNLGNSQIFDDGTNVGVGTGSPNGKLDVANTSNTVRGMQVINSSTTNPSSTIFAQNNSIGAADPVESAAVTGLFSPIAVATPIIAGPSAIKGIGSPTATIGFAGGMGVQGASGNGMGVVGISNNGTGVYAYGVNGISYALQTNGKVQIQGQGAGAGKVLSSDATGNATWTTAASLNIVSGNGTFNYIPKWTPDGNTLGNSIIYGNGVQIGISTSAPTYKLDVVNGGSDGIRSRSSSSFSVMDVDANNGDAALRFYKAGVGKWNTRNDPTGDDYQIFQIGAVERMRILSANGFVGINNNAATYQLDVKNNGNTGIRSQSIASYSVMDVDANNGDAALRFYKAGVGKWNTRNDPTGDDYQIFQIGAAERMRILSANGFVGINNNAATYQLDVKNAGGTGIRSQSSASYSVMDIDANNGDAALRFQKAGTGMWNTRNEPINNDYQWFEVGGGGERMRIQRGSGFIGINQNAPTYQLDVKHSGGTGIHIQSTASYSVMDIDAANGDAALRYYNAGIAEWNVRNEPSNNDYQIFQIGGGERMRIARSTGYIGIRNNNPQNNLHISNNADVSGITSLFAPGLTVTANLPAATFAGPGIYFENTAANSGTRVAKFVNQIVAGGSGNGTLTLMSVTDNAAGLLNGAILTADLGTGRIGIGTANPGSLLEVNGTAAKPGGGLWVASSDARLKKDVVPYTDGLKSVLAIQPVRYHYNDLSGYDTKPEYVGVIAQQLNEVAPYMISTSKKGNTDYLKVDNSAMIYMLINGMKEQQKMIDELKTEINTLKAQPSPAVKSITKTN